MNIVFYATTTLVLMAATAAGAADLPGPPAIPSVPPFIEETPTLRWAGPYIGLHGGGSWAHATINGCECGDFDGRRVGGFVGYNWTHSSGFIVGIEGDLNYEWNEDSFGAANVGTDLSGSVRLRVGEELGGLLPYVAAGWAATNAYVENPNDSDVANGWTVGAGIDWAATESTFIRLEYRYNNYSAANLAGVDVEFEQDIINIGIARKF
ncbi:outer membrane protein (plasmid) [Rhizobium etli 8C-3]|uniref:Outer membrane protein n=1 Tax=Rhizobium etli 8C-3 TaxID=538025 RepID=A0A1L5PAT4_RHIET|nr:outer membrane beta-barrel protein [Rhizobium etli]APO77190.1 outer membrane protein [Rhizobium etli 8C-3]